MLYEWHTFGSGGLIMDRKNTAQALSGTIETVDKCIKGRNNLESRAEQSRAEQSRAEQSRAEQIILIF